jgi:ketosteroid isomerase-like protein
MKKIPISLVLVLFATALSNAQSNDEKAVANAVETMRKAMVDGDRAALESIAAPELTYGHSSGKLQDKAAFVEALTSGNSDFISINLTNQTIKIVGNTALVRHELHGELASGPVNLGVLLVWQKQKNTWRLIARQAFKL